MIRLLQRLLDPAYLYALNTGPLGRWGGVYLLWAVLLLLGLAAALWWWVRSHARQNASAAWGCRAHQCRAHDRDLDPYRGRGIPMPPSASAAIVTALSCAAGLLAVILRLAAPSLTRLGLVRGLSPAARYLLLEAWTARVWPLSATLAALLVPLAHRLSRRPLPPLLQAHVDALVGHPESTTQPCPERSRRNATRNTQLFLALLHLIGLAWLWHASGHSAWWALPSLLGLSALPLLARLRRMRPTADGGLETLGPMFVAYLSAAACWFLARCLQIDVDAYQAYALPDPWSPWFNVPVVVTASVTLTLLIQVRLFMGQKTLARETRFFGKSRVSALPILLALLVVAWLAAITLLHHTHGVTASDPYCYVQMAVDLAERGTALHQFPLAGLARDLGLPTWPAVHIGYHPPGSDDLAPTMWSIGWPLLMAPLYRLGGLEALYWAAPLAGLLALIATWFLVDEALRDRPRGMRWSVAALCCALVATSPEGSERMLVPMADAAAQLFTVLTLWLLLRGQRRGHVAAVALYGALAGACFGAAYWIRHPQLPLGVAAVAAALIVFYTQERGMETAPTGCRRHPGLFRALVLLFAFGLAALLVALPDLAYHQAAFGHWLHSESSEWFLLSVRNVGRSFFGVLQQGFLRREEIGFLAPFALYGGWLLWRGQRRAAWVLFSGAGAVFLFHLLYAALRPRDLIALLPVLYLCAAYGFVDLWRWVRGDSSLPAVAQNDRALPAVAQNDRALPAIAQNDGARGRRSVLVALLLIVCTILLFARSYRTLALPWREDVITFGHVRADQLAEFQRLRELTPEDAVIGSMLNSGAIELHAGRAAVHPTPWTEKELARWMEGLWAQGRPFYVLDDGEEMPPLIERLEGRYRVQPVATLGIPYFAIGGGNLPRSARLYQIEEP